MVRKSDTAELSELEKFGFKYGTRDKFEYKTKQNGLESRIYIDLLPYCRIIEYKQSEMIKGELYTLFIRFHITGKRVEIGADKRPEEIRSMSLRLNPILNSRELQAINKKVEELEWIKIKK